jgi:hypothetical protein
MSDCELWSYMKYDKQDHQGKVALTRPITKNLWQGAQEDPKQKQDSAIGKERKG